MRVTLLLVAVAAVLSVASTPAFAQQPLSPAQIYELRVEADAAYEAGRYAEAAPLYEQIATTDPRDGEALYRWARGLFVGGDAQRALELGERAGSMGFGDAARVSLAVAQAMGRAGDTEAALEWLEAALLQKLEDRPALKNDEAFAGLRENPRFRELAGFPAVETDDRVERWHRDLEFFLEEAQRLHADPDRIAYSDAFTDRVLKLAGRVEELDDVAIAMELQRIIVSLGDGHSVLYRWVPTESVALPTPLPMTLYFFSNGLYVVDANDSHTDLIGQRVVAIGGKSVDHIVDDLRPFVSRDNDQGLFWLGPRYLSNTAALRAMGYADRLDSAIFTLQRPGGERHDVALSPPDATWDGNRLRSPGGVDQETPLWLRDIDRNYGFEALPAMRAVYAQLNRVRNAKDQSIAEFAEAVQAEIMNGAAQHLILDLRHNNGGNNFLIWPIVRLVMWHEASDPDHRVWVITGRNTFSACQNLVNFLDRETEAVFVGEPSSSKPNFVGEDTSVELPYSRLRLSISSRYWQDSYPGDHRVWVPVDVPVALSSIDYFGNRDPVMEALAEIIGG